jgi:hypothetical protein
MPHDRGVLAEMFSFNEMVNWTEPVSSCRFSTVTTLWFRSVIIIDIALFIHDQAVFFVRWYNSQNDLIEIEHLSWSGSRVPNKTLFDSSIAMVASEKRKVLKYLWSWFLDSDCEDETHGLEARYLCISWRMRKDDNIWRMGGLAGKLLQVER